MELAASDGDMPRNVAIAALVYSAVTWVAMALYGIDRWVERGEAFSVYFNLFSRISIWERRGRDIGVRPSALGARGARAAAGHRAAAGGDDRLGHASTAPPRAAPGWTSRRTSRSSSRTSRSRRRTRWWSRTRSGCCWRSLLVYGFYRLGIAGARSVGGGFDASELADAFVHSLVPIAFVYAAAHYLTLLLFQGQAIWFLASDPLGEGDDFFGTADRAIDYGVIGANATWYWQVGFVIAGHVAALMLAHDRALALYSGRQGRGSLPVLDARDHGGLHDTRAVATVTGESVIAHAGHTLVNLAFALPAVVFIGWLGWITIKDRRRAARSSRTSASDGTRTRDLRRDRPAF